uniref:Uncharacterized protein n=1 Tax=Chelydra serpentina TaxID=8475 RepID=A0A8C3RUP8_CHESE
MARSHSLGGTRRWGLVLEQGSCRTGGWPCGGAEPSCCLYLGPNTCSGRICRRPAGQPPVLGRVLPGAFSPRSRGARSHLCPCPAPLWLSACPNSCPSQQGMWGGCRGARGWQWGAAHRVGQDMRLLQETGLVGTGPATGHLLTSAQPALGRREQGWPPAGPRMGP